MTAKSVQTYTREMTLLYVEDDQVLRENTKQLFENFFSSVTTAQNGEEGLKLYLQAHQCGNPYDLIISDVMMPNLDGIAMGEAILEKEPLQALIFVTAHNEIPFLTKAINMGASGYLTKPIENDLLLKTLYRLGQAFCDRKFFLAQYDAIEILNIELMQKNAALEKSLRILDTNLKKDQIIANVPKVKTDENDQILKEQTEQIVALSSEYLYELQELHLEIDAATIEVINAMHTESDYSHGMNAFILSFQKYAAILGFHFYFKDLYRSITNLIHTITTEPPRDKETLRNAFILIESFVFVLGKWQKSIQELDLNNIHYFDASIISDIQTIINVWMGAAEENEDSIELF